MESGELPVLTPGALTDLCATSSTWNPVQSEGFWSIDMDGMFVNGSILNGTAGRAALDSGTTCVCARALWFCR